MYRDRKGGSGESQVYIRSAEAYHRQLTVPDIMPMVVPICERYGVSVPTIEIRPHRRRRWGTYYRCRSLIAINLPIKVGTVYHELAHHIAWKKYGGWGHDCRFYRILNEIFATNNI